MLQSRIFEEDLSFKTRVGSTRWGIGTYILFVMDKDKHYNINQSNTF